MLSASSGRVRLERRGGAFGSSGEGVSFGSSGEGASFGSSGEGVSFGSSGGVLSGWNGGGLVRPERQWDRVGSSADLLESVRKQWHRQAFTVP